MIHVLQWGMVPELCGGVENYIMNIYRNLDRTKIQFDFLLFHNSPKLYFEDEILEMGGKIYRDYYSIKNHPILHYKSVSNFFSEHPEIRAVHYEATALFDIDIITAAYKNKVPIRIIHSHNSGYDKKHTHWYLNWLHNFNNKRFYNLCNYHFACSKQAGKWLYGDRNYRICNNGIDIEKYTFSKEIRMQYRKELSLVNKFVLLFVARLEEQKNPYRIIEILEKLVRKKKNTVLLIAGEGTLKEEVMANVEEKGLLNNVKFLGNRDDIAQLMSTADIFLLPSLYEGLPITLIEAQANGLPCFISKEAVGRDADITGCLRYLSLKDSSDKWAFYIQNEKLEMDRVWYANVVRNAGYDIKDTTDELMKIYLSECREE